MWLHPEIRTLPDIVRHWAARAPEKEALRSGKSAWTYGQLESATNRIGGRLAALGHHQKNVCFIGKNVPEFWTLWLGAGKAGSPLVPLNWRFAVPELVELVDDARPAIVFADSEYAETMQQVLDQHDGAPELVVIDSESTGGTGLQPWLGDQPDEDPGVPITGEDVALITYTSGTTGVPKGVMIRHESFSLAVLSDELEPTISWSSDDVNLMVMPNFHLAGSWVSLPTLYHGGTVTMVPAFDPAAVLEAVETYRPTMLCLVPTALQVLLDFPATETADTSSLRTLVYAGSPISAPTIEKALSVLDVELRQFYGTTECYIISILRPDDHDVTKPEQLASCGSPIPLVDVRIVGADGDDVADGEIGQVLVRSPMVMSGYYGRPEESAAVLKDGWYWTGDLGYRNAEGFYFLVDRVKDMVVSGGENIYSVEVERAIQRHPDVAMAAVVGTPDAQWGEVVTAFVVPRPGVTIDPDELRDHCRTLIAAYKVPKRVHVEEALPMTTTGKIRKVDLRRQVRS